MILILCTMLPSYRRTLVLLMKIKIIKPTHETISMKSESCNINNNTSSNVQPLQQSPQPPQPPQPQQPQQSQPPEPKKISQSKKYLNEWNEKGKVIPTCINDGCEKSVAIRHWSNALPSLKTECSTCSSARIKNKKIDGVTFHKKQICENKDGILGFTCAMDKERYHEFPTDCYHMDHLDGNHENNTPDNVKTFCAICHTRKGKESGDFNSFKSSSRVHKV
jgi:hypothetical protein